MHEDLLGYLLGALEPHEMRRVAQWLRDDPAAQEQLAEIERSLKPLEQSPSVPEPPPSDLVARTMAALPPLPSSQDSAGPEAVSGPPLVPMRNSVETLGSSTATWMDWSVGAVAAAILLGLLLPTLAEGRFTARKIACQDHLRQFGTAITQFVNQNPQDRLPAVSEVGPEAFAGVYAVRLNDSGLLHDPSIRWCPSLDAPSREQLTLTSMQEVASRDELHVASVDRLRKIQQFVGGQYAYTLGVMEQKQLASPRFESRASFAVMADAPLSSIANREDLAGVVGHSGDGINVLFEDGRVQFLSLSSLDSMPDHPLLNNEGKVEAGVNVDDASLAPSWRPPFFNVQQR
ncbi:MAG: anti-sigma factor [Rubripirellula sp.]